MSSSSACGRIPPTKKRLMESQEYQRLTIGLVSYPRSGNSLMRSLIEDITGVYTGSDTKPDRSLSLALKESGFLGEGVVKDQVWCAQTTCCTTPAAHTLLHFFCYEPLRRTSSKRTTPSATDTNASIVTRPFSSFETRSTPWTPILT